MTLHFSDGTLDMLTVDYVSFFVRDLHILEGRNVVYYLYCIPVMTSIITSCLFVSICVTETVSECALFLTIDKKLYREVSQPGSIEATTKISQVH